MTWDFMTVFTVCFIFVLIRKIVRDARTIRRDRIESERREKELVVRKSTTVGGSVFPVTYVRRAKAPESDPIKPERQSSLELPDRFDDE